MALPPLPQFTNDYEGEKLRYMVQVLENALKDFSQVDLLANKLPIIYPQYNTVGNVGGAETTLYSGTITPLRYFNPGWQINIEAFGTFAGNNDTKELKLYLNGMAIYDSTALTVNGGTWSLNIVIIVTSGNSQQILVTTNSNNNSFPAQAVYSAGTVTLGSTNTIALTASGSATNDIVGQTMILTTQPN